MVGETMSEDTMYIGFDREFDPAELDEPVETERPKPPTEDVKRLALETIQGKHGRLRKDREAALGDLYQDVMAEVIRIRLQGV